MLVTFLHLKREFRCSYVLALFTNFNVVAAMLPTMAKLNVILKSECLNTWNFQHPLGKELKGMTILLLKKINYYALTRLILTIYRFSLPTITALE